VLSFSEIVATSITTRYKTQKNLQAWMQNLFAVKGYRRAAGSGWQRAHRGAVGTNSIQTIVVATQQLRSLLINMKFVKCAEI
jgi:hypothetical protein